MTPRQLPSGGIGGLWEPVLHNYLYRRWFQPYLSDIDHGEYIAMVMNPIDQPPTSNNEVTQPPRLYQIETPPFYTTRPLFRAFFIAIPGQNWDGCTALEHIASLKVLMILTGEIKGLSGPISFASIADKSEIRTLNGLEAVETDLETAVDFTMDLEHREEAVFAWTGFGAQVDAVMMNHRERVMWNWHRRNLPEVTSRAISLDIN
ncbi:hypothetical protein DER46DRAFT_621213 [Fusarium sp. MPI-SDFR-AT-0072]|nr:hypothetical protein DER46DRAFT_621213 [Fusarium sp. MPI-SDFR-AT-0072]